MKRVSFAIVCLLFAYSAIGQQTFSAKLPNEKDAFTVASNSGRFRYDSYAILEMKDYAPIGAEDVISWVRAYLAEAPTENKYPGNIAEWNLIKKYYSNIEGLFNNLSLIGGDQSGQFIFTKGVDLPIRFLLFGDAATSVIVQNAYIDNIYNTIQLTSKQRATRVITGYILPSLKYIAEAFPEPEVKYYGMTCIYGSKKLTDRNNLELRGEFVGLIATTKIIRQFVSGDISEDELLNAASIFSSDRDMASGIKKVSIVIE